MNIATQGTKQDKHFCNNFVGMESGPTDTLHWLIWLADRMEFITDTHWFIPQVKCGKVFLRGYVNEKEEEEEKEEKVCASYQQSGGP